MKAAYIEQYGGSDEFKVGEIEQPTIDADDVLIEVHAASVNPVDWKLREGYLKEMLSYDMPLVIGWDVSGVIKEVGANVTDLKVGDEVFSRPDIARQGTYAEYVAVDAHLVVKKASLPELRGGRIIATRRAYGMASHVRSDGCETG
ncbi:alcohol dehydrogenase catalytic domain-containing protein [Exiguobacterium sp. s80]|uniref:alcohol dehydrogenase catalytic domain-containing protein n=1 Tax=Exiguobacterium sp. s80 TaxID=2751209 RepID=UPI0035303561